MLVVCFWILYNLYLQIKRYFLSTTIHDQFRKSNILYIYMKKIEKFSCFLDISTFTILLYFLVAFFLWVCLYNIVYLRSKILVSAFFHLILNCEHFLCSSVLKYIKLPDIPLYGCTIIQQSPLWIIQVVSSFRSNKYCSTEHLYTRSLKHDWYFFRIDYQKWYYTI